MTDELRRHDEDRTGALADLRRRNEQLLLRNAELQQANRGVLALYRELAEELEQTNQGVVALYAELDDKSGQLRAASQAKDRFWANVSHELRTPLNSVLGLTRLLAEPDSGLGAEQRYQVDLIRSATSTLLTLVDDLLDVAKAESGQLVVDPAEVSLPALLATLRGLSRPMTEGKPVEVTVSAGDAPATVLTDEAALTAIVRNLLSNAIKYTDAGEVRLTARTRAGQLEIEVADTGTGIPADLLERVFEEFYQVPGARRGGTGLGLPYARRLSALLGGELTLASEPGRGTTALLRLPCGLPSLGPVVVTGDDPAVRARVRSLLAGVAGPVTEAADEEQALAAVAAGPVDLVVADLSRPGTDGAALLERLPPELPLIVITGPGGPRPERAAARLPGDRLTRERLLYAASRAVREPR